MKRLSLLMLALAACGPADGSLGKLPAGIVIQGLSAEQVGAVQITVLKNATNFVCSDIVKTCLNERIKAGEDTVPITGKDGKEHNAFRETGFTAADLMNAGVTFQISIPAGTNYMVVVEILSADAKLLASGCEVRQEVVAGEDNSPLVIRAQPIEPVPQCDPRID